MQTVKQADTERHMVGRQEDRQTDKKTADVQAYTQKDGNTKRRKYQKTNRQKDRVIQYCQLSR